ncbi:MAG TPA: TolC family protein [Polyangiales bacterium]|nr:TolC family protein [Polyangiales bacterium]
MDITTTRRAVKKLLPASALLIASGCAPSLEAHVSTVRTLSHAQLLPSLREGEVDPTTADQARKLLQRPLDANAAVRIALVNNRELRAQLRELGIPASQLLTAGLIGNPTLEFELLPERDSRYELRAEYDLTSLIMAPLRRGAARDSLEAARLRAAGEVIQLGYDTRTRFFALQAAVQRQQLAQQTLDALAAGRDAAQALLDAGNISPLDAASQIAAYERTRASVATLELEAAERKEALQRTLGLHGDEASWQLAGGLAPAPENLDKLDDVEQRALTANLEVRAAQKTLDSLAKQSGIVRTAAWLPELAADVHALRVRGEDGARDGWRYGAGVSLQLPLFDRGQGRLRGVEAQFDAALERFQGFAIDLRSAARDTRNRLVSTHARAHQYETIIVPAQRTVLDQTMLQYNAMQIGIFQLLQARRELLDVELSRVDTLRDYWSAVAELQALTQGRLVRTTTSQGSSAALSASSSSGEEH